MTLYLDIYSNIFEYCSTYDQLNIMMTCKILNKKLKIKKLNHPNVSDDILKQEKFTDLEELYASYNEKITNVNHLSKLKILNCFRDCGIDQEGIKNLQLIEELDASYNKKIKNVNHLTKLKILNCSNDCGIDQEGIKDLQLIEELDASYNEKIKDVNHLTKLKILSCSFDYGIDQKGIKDLQLIEELYASA